MDGKNDVILAPVSAQEFEHIFLHDTPSGFTNFRDRALYEGEQLAVLFHGNHVHSASGKELQRHVAGACEEVQYPYSFQRNAVLQHIEQSFLGEIGRWPCFNSLWWIDPAVAVFAGYDTHANWSKAANQRSMGPKVFGTLGHVDGIAGAWSLK